MRKQDKIILWPAYFELARTRMEGRRVPKNLAILSPRISEMKDAADKLHMNCELTEGTAFSKTPWLESGMILIDKKGSKEETIRKMAEQLLKIRSTSATK